MAQGRILSKRAGKSEKLNKLESDTDRLIYSWLIPHTDVNGCIEIGNLKLLKAEVVPLLDHITPEKLGEILQRLHDIELIVIYKIANKTYLQILNFDEHQANLRKEKEAKPTIPTCPPELRRNSAATPSTGRYNIIEDKENIRLREAKEQQERPVDNSQDNPLKEFKALLEKTKEKYPDPYDQQKILVFIQANLRNKNKKAIIHCLESLIKSKEKVKAIPQFLEAVLKIENGKYNAADEEAKNNKLKAEPINENLKALLAGIGN